MDEPWEVDIAVHTQKGIDPNKALTVTILRWLWHGDFRPLVWAIRKGFVIDEAVLSLLANMIEDGRIEIKRKKGGRPKAVDKFARDYIAALQYNQNVTRGKSDATFEEVAKGLIGGRRSDRTVRQAVTKMPRKPNSA